MASKRDRRNRERTRRRTSGAESPAGPARITARKIVEETEQKARLAALDFVRRDDLSEDVTALAERTRDVALSVMRQSPLDGKHACQPGCGFCCHTYVTAAPPELFAIVEYLKAHYSADEIAGVRRRVDENAKLAASMTREEYISKNIPCAMLTVDHNCCVHPVRPLCCAGFLSTSREKCEAEFNHAVGRDAVPTDRFAMLAGLAVSYGLKAACRENDLDGTFYEFHHALQRALDDPTAAAKWAGGNQPFEGCSE